ncbi:MAG TPA: pyridoxamine 5'-phosphate oxidase family protein [Methylovirgula sp.]
MTNKIEPADAKFDPVEEAKRLLRTTRAAALATATSPDGSPFASLVNVATAPDASPLLLLSRLAAHTHHLEADPRLSLLFYSALNRPNGGDPLTHPRLTIVGTATRIDDAATRAAVRARFLARHPKSSLYADFADFSFFHVAIDTAHLNGGFGRAAHLSPERLLTSLDGADLLIVNEEKLIADITTADPTLPARLAAIQCGEGEAWRLAGFDPEGLDLADEERLIRVVFAERVTNEDDLRQQIAVLLEKS